MQATADLSDRFRSAGHTLYLVGGSVRDAIVAETGTPLIVGESDLDFTTDARLRAALKKETTDSTVIIVAQRVGTVMHADQIIVLEDGTIVGKGTHEELLKTSETYREIVESQLGAEGVA